MIYIFNSRGEQVKDPSFMAAVKVYRAGGLAAVEKYLDEQKKAGKLSAYDAYYYRHHIANYLFDAED